MPQATSGTPPLPDEIQHSALLQLLSNTLILCHATPYLPVTDILTLAATSRAFRYLIYETPQVFRYLDLRPLKSAQFDIEGIDHGGETWRNVQLDENLTEDDFYSGPLRGILSNLRRTNILSDVQVLVLDGLAVTADLVHDILTDSSYSVRILSLRECKHLNGQKLRGALQYACRSSRPEGTPRLKGLYIFGKAEAPPDGTKQVAPSSVAASTSGSGPAVAAAWNARSQKALTASSTSGDHGAEEPWYGLRGWQFAGTSHIHQDWSQTLLACNGIIAFDAVLCAGPRHLNSPAWGKVNIDTLNAASSSATPDGPHWNVAQFSVGGCAGCGSAPEGWTVWGEDDTTNIKSAGATDRRGSDSAYTDADIGRFPLLPHPPLHSPSIKVAMCPTGQPLNARRVTSSAAQPGKARFIPRCGACLRDRYCTACHRWWCESCYIGPWATSSPGSQNVALVSLPSSTNSTTENVKEPHFKVRGALCCTHGGCGAGDASLQED
ncbi:hypothetical protein CONLIGDRAFT_648850 [Coniochaeta ligniaria NRRL 30616]|uniref:F-box domain-containing protein n=1 Tax=Coniochaeta ligniaria NRRL 30616 TaxID=1408157 RepID=A0A1J7J6E1_9PEZI|nr:hypothetical protein CONLIGDRAFT_648850 [Coniochaeta ligniaria NRRL 30616]